MSKKKREAVLKAEQNEQKNLPDMQENSTNDDKSKEESNMDLKENGWQKLGNAILEHGNKKAEYAKEHPTASKVKTGLGIAGGAGLVIATVVAAIVKGKKKSECVETNDEYYDDPDDLYEGVDDLEDGDLEDQDDAETDCENTETEEE